MRSSLLLDSTQRSDGRILHLLADHELGGGSVIVSHLARASALHGRHVVLLPGNAAQDVVDLFKDMPHRRLDFVGRGSILSMAREVRREATPSDLVHAHGARAALAALAPRLLRLPGARVVYTVHGFHSLARPDALRLRWRMENWLAGNADAVTFVSQSDAALARRASLVYRRPPEVIENGIPDAGVAPDRPRAVDVLFVGRLVHQKNPEAFVETAARLSPGRRVVMIGGGDKALEIDKRIAQRAPGRIERIDGLDHSGVLAAMADARILVMTSRWEGLPTVAIEAATLGCLPVGYAIPPLAEVLEDVAEQTLSPPDADALAARIEALLDDEAARVGLARRAQAAASRRFSLSRMSAAYDQVYGGLLTP